VGRGVDETGERVVWVSNEDASDTVIQRTTDQKRWKDEGSQRWRRDRRSVNESAAVGEADEEVMLVIQVNKAVLVFAVGWVCI